MSTFTHTIVRTARTFDGTTHEDAEGWSHPLDENYTYTFKGPDDAGNYLTVGSWSTKDLGSRAADRPLAFWFRLDGTPQVGSLLAHKTAAANDAPPGYTPLDLLLEQFQITNKLQGPIVLGATDRVCVTHNQGGQCSVQFVVMEATQAAQLGLIRDLTNGGGDEIECCSRESTTVTGSTDLDPWGSKELVVFVNAPENGTPAEINMPALADLEIGQSALFVRIGGGLVYVGTNVVGDKINGQTNQAFELAGYTAIRVTREETTFSATIAMLTSGASLTNAVANAVVDLPSPVAPSHPVRTNFSVRTFLRCPQTALFAVGDEMPIIQAGTGATIIVPRTGELLNGETNGRAYVSSVDAPVIKKTIGGLIVLGSGNLRAPPIVEVPAGAAVIPAFNGTLVYRFTEAAAQAGTLPLASECGPESLLIIESVGGNKTISRTGGDTINGKGSVGATNIVAATGVNLYLRPAPDGHWSAL